jgi:hypothetical protein
VGPFRLLYQAIFIAIAAVFALCAVGLLVLAVGTALPAVMPGDLGLRPRFLAVLEAVGILTVAVAALELSGTVIEEEVRRSAHLSSPTRVRRFLSRFLVVVVVSSSIEFLIGIFEHLREKPEELPHVATIGIASALILAAWGLFVRLNRAAEQLEPEALETAKAEDRKVEP